MGFCAHARSPRPLRRGAGAQTFPGRGGGEGGRTPGDLRPPVRRGAERAMSRAGLVYEWEHEGFRISPMTEHDLLEVVEIEETCGLSLWGWDAYRAELERPESVMLVAHKPAT